MGGRAGRIYFKDTCPLDNFFAIFHVISENFQALKDIFASDLVSPVSLSLVQVLDKIAEGKAEEAKLIWANLLGLKENHTSQVIDFNGSEFQRFVSVYVRTWFQHNLETTCDSCRFVSTRSVYGATLTYWPEAWDNFEHVFSMWLYPPATGRKCPQCHSELPGSRRLFKAFPPVLVIEIAAESTEQGTVSPRDLTPVVAVPNELLEEDSTEDGDYRFGALYQLAGCTFANGYHFSGSFQSSGINSLAHGWYIYDGLTGHRRIGSLPPPTPPGCSLSYVVYSLLPPVYTKEAINYLCWLEFGG